MSTDSNADTVIVKNILAHVLSPKIVDNGLAIQGYETKVDIVNIDNVVAQKVIFSNAQTGNYILTSADNGRQFINILNSNVTINSIIFATIRHVSDTTDTISVVKVKSLSRIFQVYLSREIETFGTDNTSDLTTEIGWFIAKF